jgi:hypothetical protein
MKMMGTELVELLKTAEQTPDPEIRQASVKWAGLVERTSLYGSVADSTLNWSKREIDQLIAICEATNPAEGSVLAQMSARLQHFRRILTVPDVTHPEEAQFVRRYSAMAKHRMLLDAGIDPNDFAAVTRFFNGLVPLDVDSRSRN